MQECMNVGKKEAGKQESRKVGKQESRKEVMMSGEVDACSFVKNAGA